MVKQNITLNKISYVYVLIYQEKDSLLSKSNSRLLTAKAHFTNALEAQNFDIVDIVLTALAKPMLLESHSPSGSA